MSSTVRMLRGSEVLSVPIWVITLVSAATLAITLASCTFWVRGFWQ
ncbi:MAG: hypothetical protein NTW28_29430 [Candidatus Solibacter sp.]|nr:hypothetical protein [Candidatus Solibacter sp.]